MLLIQIIMYKGFRRKKENIWVNSHRVLSELLEVLTKKRHIILRNTHQKARCLIWIMAIGSSEEPTF